MSSPDRSNFEWYLHFGAERRRNDWKTESLLCRSLSAKSKCVSKKKTSLSNANSGHICYIFYTENKGKAEKNQIAGIRSSVFYPLRMSNSVVTAQILWEAMDPQPNGYQVRVLSTSNLTGCGVTVSS